MRSNNDKLNLQWQISNGVKGFKNKKIKRFTKEIEPQEILLDNLAKEKEREFRVSEKKLETPLSKSVIQGFYITFLLLIFVLLGKTFQLQVIEGENFTALAEENKFIIHQIKAKRGVIYDRNFNQLVFNRPAFNLICQKNKLPEDDQEKIEILKEISKIINKDFKELKKEIEESEFSKILIAENLEHQTLISLETRIADLPGFQIEDNTTRDYIDGKDFAHLIGYTGKITAEELKASPGSYSITDRIGRAGLERYYEENLRKKPGELRVERDAQGNVISREIISLPESGESLVLWLDAGLQKKIEEELLKSLKNIGAEKGAVVALDPKTGGVLALVSLPSFDNNLFNKGADPETLESLLTGPLEPLFNRVITGQYPTGSTIKPLIASAALEEKIISPEKLIYDPGQIEVPHRYNPEIIYTFKDWKVHGWTDMRKAIAESCNVYFYTVGGGYADQEGLGPSRIKKYLQLFGWGNKTQIDLLGEAEGLLPDPQWKETVKKENWWDGDTYHLSIGQGDILATPLQVATAFSAIANGGKLLKPQIVQKIVESEKNLVEEIKPRTIRQNFIDPQNLQIIREGMGEAVTYGSAVLLNSLPVKAAAKTGTAQTPKPNYYHNWVTVFAPYDNPQIVLTIVIENVREVRAAALPVAKGILEWYFSE